VLGHFGLRDDRESRRDSEIEITIERSGTAYGLSAWFDSVLAEGIGFSNGPDAPETIFSSLFFPWSEPIAVVKGDIVRVKLRADLKGEDYIYSGERSSWTRDNPAK
jgi:hypothetical protein